MMSSFTHGWQLWGSLLLLPLVTSFAPAEDATVAEESLLVEPEEFTHQRISEAALNGSKTYLDVRSAGEFARGHVPGARRVDVNEWQAAFGDGSDAADWSKRIASVLSDAEGQVVIYDQTFTPNAARVWWILKYWGVSDVRILDGGFKAFMSEGGRPVYGVAHHQPTDFVAQPQPERLAKYQDVLAIARGEQEACLLDARTDEENTAGHIPSAEHLDWQAMVDEETGRLKPPDELRQLLAQTEFDAASPVVTYCQSSGRASVVAFVVEHLTGKPAANYHGSWGEWTQRGGPKSTSGAE